MITAGRPLNKPDDHLDEAIVIKNYGFQYESTEKQILNNCNLTVNHGEFVVLSGHSGSGKSTLLSGIIGYIPNIVQGKATGDIFVNGENTKGEKVSRIAKKIGSVLQNADCQIIHAGVEDEIAFGCENMGINPEETAVSIEDACSRMELDKRDNTRNLSGGQKQKLITATTLGMKQKILVFDEPLANLDLQSSIKLIERLRDLCCTRGYAVLFAEHRLDIVMRYADRLIWLENGCTREISDYKKEFRKHTGTIKDNSLTENSGKIIMSLRNISYEAGGKKILSDICLDIKKGERIVLLGENGCGKTTLLRTIAMLNKKTSGEIKQYFCPRKKKMTITKWLGEVGLVYQNPGYQLFMPSVREEILYKAAAEKDLDFYIDKYNLNGLEDHHSHSLSEGQKRRLSIAVIAARKPRVLLLDEPTVGQDHDSLEKLINNLNDLKDEYGTSLVTVTHDYRCACAIADKVLIMQKGRIIKSGGKELIDEYFQLSG